MSGNDSNDLLRIGTGKVNRVYPLIRVRILFNTKSTCRKKKD